ncbi:UDP-N-acetyl-D-galactosamine dehydrogenase [Dyadobacter sp. BE34]|uniref:UDP-N-acetyl-D-galactosamine dehydrogenase n=1 Tax=Dyadobacter fermentans TaxID=94254 RepID=A0ABU1QU09_9BACT|nr:MULTISPECIES: nucleotide sugar dehydrogenase [Dyadobacter]MDR6803770.1 UDP-N-acetyl-D-galactosamine dehydrogenase [Dyadobacter fermentans]MDR7041510.1 UDP-N-acetyl-D-galactosamine dehydrogenase [Dyadobacter sp. BE242]MDR7195913.1 UDP-N-acetyl-D-galactosamine dehydrogenase [Dyadobacter sp. BE34]MDR7213542.1 UDP-N-acetyl-D-galactosamine dehydrogenase [Dyadobacter sp. BE31]MDR7261319.1 UDP-N-acetyl-D-galactosamine dehydrogenase [Dyadobacter sp. BE32]
MLAGSDVRIAVIGLGYVGLPLAVAFSKKYPVTGFDINKRRIQELKDAYDTTKEISRQDLRKAVNLAFSWDEAALKECNVFIVTVPTPVDHYKKPNLTHLLKASGMIGQMLKKGDVVIYESTVYPGCTEDDCVPVLERESGLKFNEGFFCGYSPERINPGDKINTFTKIKKVTSGSTPETARFVDSLYASVIDAGTHLASSMKVAEASKAIENAQRDVNISFVNELALIFDRMNIDTTEVLEAAATKWNFLKYKPGLVGGHCIGVDPYYLAYKAESLGYYPQVILSGRRVNDMMGVFVANKLVKLMIRKGHKIEGSRVLILGITFKENCPDIRNTRVIDVYRELTDFGMQVEVHDPWASAEQVLSEYNIATLDKPAGKYEAVVLAVAHQEFKAMEFGEFTAADSVIFDLKSVLPQNMVDSRL